MITDVVCVLFRHCIGRICVSNIDVDDDDDEMMALMRLRRIGIS